MMQESVATSNHLHKAALLILLWTLSVSVHATPSVNLPINAQVPPVARPNQAYDFVFSDSTFSWAGDSIGYSLANGPGWLQLDSTSRVFSGTPEPADAGSFAVDLVATDETGSSSMSVTFVVSSDPGPELGTSVAEQLPTFGRIPSPGSLSLAPSSALALSFSPDTFTNTNANTVYYALCANNTPLPSWVNFHPSNLTFSGITPSSTSPWELPQAFRIQLIASDVIGFSEAVASFQLVVESHVLLFGSSLHVINITSGVQINFSDLPHDLTLDGQPANSSDLRQVVASTPSWMSFSSSTLTLSGTPPANAASQNFTVTASDVYGDTASTIILLQNANSVMMSPFVGPSATVDATTGTNFTYHIKSMLVSDSTAKVAVDLGAASAWLNFNSTSLELQGLVPTNLQPQPVHVTVNATLGSQSQSQTLTIEVQNTGVSSVPTTDSHSSSPKATSGSTAGRDQSADATSSAHGPPKRWIAAAVIIPILFASGFLLLLCFCLKRRRRRKADKNLLPPSKWRISRPILEKNTPNTEVRAETWGTLAINEKRASSRGSKAPWSDLLGFQIPGHSNRSSKSLKSRLSDSAIGSAEHSRRPGSVGFSFSEQAKDKSMPEVSCMPEKRILQYSGKTSCGLKAPSSAVHRLSVIMDGSPPKKHSKQKRRRSNLSYETASVFTSQRLSGIGHGCTTLSQGSSNLRFGSKGVGHGSILASGPPGFGIVRNSWRNLSRSTWASTDGSSNPGLEREGYPSNSRPPTSNTVGKGSQSHVIHEVSDDERSHKPTLRPVLSPTQSRIRRQSGSPSRPKSNFLKVDPLQSFHKRRLQQRSSRNPLFSAGPSSFRISSVRGMKTAPLQSSFSQSGSTCDNNGSERPVTPQRGNNQRSNSESSSVEPPVRSSPSRSSSSPTSPCRQKSYIKYKLKTRALSPPSSNRRSRMNSRGSSWVSTSSESKIGSAASEAPPFNGFGEDLREETDENGNKRWLRGHPNPLGTHRLDVTDQELIDRLRVSGHVSAAQRLSYLMRAQTDGKPDHGAESGDEAAQVKIGSTKGKRLGQIAGLRQGAPGTMSMRGDIGNTTAGSAFI